MDLKGYLAVIQREEGKGEGQNEPPFWLSIFFHLLLSVFCYGINLILFLASFLEFKPYNIDPSS